MQHALSEEKRDSLSVAIEMDRKLKSSSDWLLGQLETFKKPLEVLFRANGQNKEIGKTQFRNLHRLSTAASGLAELSLYIRYQMGRDTDAKGWYKEVEGRPFGEWLIEILTAIEAKSQELASEWPADLRRTLFLKMAERFFVYLNWHVTFLESELKSTSKKESRRHDARRDKGGRR